MRRTAWVVGLVALVGCGAYVFVYLYRWEWNRALMMAAFFLATEIALATALLLRRIARSGPAKRPTTEEQTRALIALRRSAPSRDHFAWLGVHGDRTSVFITMFVGGGIILSGLAWAIDRVASRTAGRQMEESLAAHLASIAYPAEGLVADETEVLAEPAPFEDDPDLRLLLGTPAAR